MIFIGNVRNAGFDKCDARYAITRSSTSLARTEDDYNQSIALAQAGRLKSAKIPWFGPNYGVCEILSPSPELHAWTNDQQFRYKTWGPDAFNGVYVKEFLSQMRHDPRVANILNGLVALDRSGKNIQLDCFCGRESLCHRSIIAGMLQGAGANVKTIAGDYSRYYGMYMQAEKTPMTERYLASQGVTAAQADLSGKNRALGSEFDIPDAPGGMEDGLGF